MTNVSLFFNLHEDHEVPTMQEDLLHTTNYKNVSKYITYLPP